MHRSLLILAGVVLGIAVGGGAAALVSSTGDTATDEAATVISTTLPPIVVEAPWAEGGVRFRSSVLTPVAFTVEDGVAELEFTVTPLHWTALDDEGEPFPDAVPVRPEHWELATATGTTYETSTVIDEGVVRFAVPEDTSIDDVAVVRVVGWRVAAPERSSVTVPLEPGERRTFPNGATAEIETVLEQANSTIVQLNSLLADDPWMAGHSLAFISVPDPGWRVGFRFNQSTNVQLIWEGAGAPDEVELVQEYPEWQPVAADTIVIGAGP